MSDEDADDVIDALRACVPTAARSRLNVI